MATVEVSTEGGELAVTVDGHQIEDLEGVEFTAHRGEKAMMQLVLSADEVKIDTDAFMWIKGKLREQQGG